MSCVSCRLSLIGASAKGEGTYVSKTMTYTFATYQQSKFIVQSTLYCCK